MANRYNLDYNNQDIWMDRKTTILSHNQWEKIPEEKTRWGFRDNRRPVPSQQIQVHQF